jgi:hypothetical protein
MNQAAPTTNFSPVSQRMLVSDAVQKAYSFFTVSIEPKKMKPTISDSGATCNCISNDVALELIEAGVTDRMHALDKPISIQFGVKSAKTPVIGIISSGLIDDIYVVNNELPVMLISNTSLVDKGHLCAG